MDEIEFGAMAPRRPWMTFVGLAGVLVVLLGLVIWQRPRPTQAISPVVHSSPIPVVQMCCAGESSVGGTTFEQGFEVRNIGSLPATITEIAAEVPASFYETAVGLWVPSSANDSFRQNLPLLSTYTMPAQSSAYVVVGGFVTCPATYFDADPKVMFDVNGTAMSFETPTMGTGTWEENVAETACAT